MSASPISEDEGLNEKWKHILRLTNRESVFAHPAFEAGKENFDAIQQCKVLVVGAGGLGCEILKGLALSGFKDITTIDMDTIDLSNLNRQFLFRETDIGKSKAEVAAEFVNKRVDGVEVKALNKKIQEMDLSFYQSFAIVICGLDSIVARRWLNATMCSLVQFDSDGEVDPSTIIPLIDGGTEGFKGNARVVFPFFTPCIECTLDLYPPQINFPLCTIAHTPRLPEHCIEYVKVILWDEKKPFDDEAIDGDNPDHLQWIMQRAQERAIEFNIVGVDFRLTQGVVKRIIPAVASTNAIIAGSCVLEALKLASNIGCPLDNYLNFSNIDGIFIGPVKLDKNPRCIVCSKSTVEIETSKSELLRNFINVLMVKFQLKEPNIRTSENYIYLINPLFPDAERTSRENLKKSLHELQLSSGDELLVSDISLAEALTLRLKFTEDIDSF